MRKRRFLLVYLASAVLGTVLVFFGAPLVRASIPQYRFDGMVKACRSETPLAGLLSAAFLQPPRPPEQPEFARPPGPQPRIGRASSSVAPPADAASYSRVSRQRDEAATATTGTADRPPSAPYDYRSMWAIVTNDSAAVYDGSGNLAQELAAGTLVEVAALRQTPADTLAVCRFDTKPAAMEVAIIRARDLFVRKGSLDSADTDLLTLLRKQVQLETEIRALASSRDEEIAKRNPHAQEYLSARSAVLTFNENAKAMRATADKTSGSARVEAMDRLRAMKEEEAALRRRYDAARRSFEDWNRLNGQDATETESIKILRQRLADVREQVGRIDTR